MKDIFKIGASYFMAGLSLVLGFKMADRISNKIDEFDEKRSNKIDNGTEENT